ncbi:MAG TPA: class I SAM-dependent methyltransferase [Chthoniobacteraceae bacterium]|nr:class I SAM-dependent methyltransferase [Chthoniobacteraceae bacterium]
MNLKPLLRRCPVCDCAEGEVLHTQRFILADNHPLKDGYDVVCCARCGFCFADTAATQRDYDEFYANFSKYADSKTSTGGGAMPWDLERLSVMAAEIARIKPDRAARILDMGCANGGLLRALRDLGFTRLCGIDPSPACAEQTRRASGADAFAGSLFNMPAEAGMFDGMILSHVLEHIRDLKPALVEMRRFLNPGAWLYVETPDASRYKDHLISPFQDFNTEHINHFSVQCMVNLLAQCGFTSFAQGQKTILSAPNMPYPALFVFADLAPGGATHAVVKDETLKRSLVEYISVSRRSLDGIEAQLQAAIRAHPELIVWGTGQLTMKLLAETSLGRANIVAFTDSNPTNQGKLLRGVPVVAPQSLTARDVPILVASTINADSILASIQQLNLPNPVIRLSAS